MKTEGSDSTCSRLLQRAVSREDCCAIDHPDIGWTDDTDVDSGRIFFLAFLTEDVPNCYACPRKWLSTLRRAVPFVTLSTTLTLSTSLLVSCDYAGCVIVTFKNKLLRNQGSETEC